MALPILNTQIQTMGDLKNAISIWSNRDDPEFLGQLQNFINFAEKDIYRRLRIPSLEREIYLNIQNGVAHIPVDMVETKYVMNLQTGSMFRVTSLEEVQWNRQNKLVNTTNFNEQEIVFARANNRLFFAPAVNFPSDGITTGDIVMGYISDSPELMTDTDTCNILTIAPDLMLYMAMKHACLFVQDDDGAQKWGAMAEASLAVVQEQAKRAEYSGSPLVIPNVLDNSTMRTTVHFGVVRG